jgi:hypothetical protein
MSDIIRAIHDEGLARVVAGGTPAVLHAHTRSQEAYLGFRDS